MNILEKTLEDIVFQTPNEILRERGLHIEGLKKRQVKIGNYGIADIITVRREHYLESKLVFTIIELKQNKIDVNTLLQAAKYAKGLKHYLYERGVYPYRIEIKLIGTQIDKTDAFLYLTDLVSNHEPTTDGIVLDYYTMTLDFNGVSFEQHCGYELTNTGFQ